MAAGGAATIQRTCIHGSRGFLPPEVQQALPVDLVPLARNLVAKTTGRQLRNYGYQLAGLGHAMCGALAASLLEVKRENAVSPFKYTVLRSFFGSSANFSNNAYFLVSNAMTAHAELQEMRERLLALLECPEMISSLESFLFTGFSQRHLLSRLGWNNWPWVRNFVRYARNQMDNCLPVKLQRAPVPARMADSCSALLKCLGPVVIHGTKENDVPGNPGLEFPLPAGFPLTAEQLQEVTSAAVKHSLLPFLWSATPLPAGLFPRETGEAAELLREHVNQQLSDPEKQVLLFSEVKLQPVHAGQEEIAVAIETITNRVKKTEQELMAAGKKVTVLKTFRRKMEYLGSQPAALQLLAETAWFPQARLVQRVARALTVLTGKKRLGSAVAAIAARVVVTRSFKMDSDLESNVACQTSPAGSKAGVNNTVLPQLPVTLPFHSTDYRYRPVAFPLLENKYTFRYPSCEQLTLALRGKDSSFTLASTAALTAEARYEKLACAVNAGEKEAFQRGLSRTRSYLVDELPWAVTGRCIKDKVEQLEQNDLFSGYLEKSPLIEIKLSPRLLSKIRNGAELQQIMLVPPDSPANFPTCRLILKGTPYQLYHRDKTSPDVPSPEKGDIPVFPVIPLDGVDLDLLADFTRYDGIETGKLPLPVQRDLRELFSSACLSLDVNRLGSEQALVFGGWCHGQFYQLARDYQNALNAQFQRWASHLEVLDGETSRLNRRLARYRNKGHPVDTDWYRRRVKELRCVNRRKHELKKAAYLRAAETIYKLITETRPDFFFYEDLQGLSTRGKRGSFAKLLTWMLTRIDAVMELVENWCQASGVATRFKKLDARNTSSIHNRCGGRLLRGPGQWDNAPCKRCGQLINTHVNAAFNLIIRGLTRYLDLILSGLEFPPDQLPSLSA